MADRQLEWVFDSLVEFLRGPIWNIPVLTFIEQKSVVFEPGAENEEELKKIHEAYKNLVDFMLGSYMEDLRITPEEFEKSCSVATKKALNQFHQNLFQQVWAADDFEIFKRMMTQKNLELQLQALEFLTQKRGSIPNCMEPNNDMKDEERAMEEIIKKAIGDICEEAEDKEGNLLTSADVALSEKMKMEAQKEKELLEQALQHTVKEKDLNADTEEGIPSPEQHAADDVLQEEEKEEEEGDEEKEALPNGIENEEGVAKTEENQEKEEVEEDEEPKEDESEDNTKEEEEAEDNTKEEEAESEDNNKEEVAESEPTADDNLQPVNEPEEVASESNSTPDVQVPDVPGHTLHGSLPPIEQPKSVPKLSLIFMETAEERPWSEGDSTTYEEKAQAEVTPLDMEKRQNYLRQQRDRILAMKKQERSRRLSDADEAAQGSRPRSARAARKVLREETDEQQVDPGTMVFRRSLAAKLRSEVIDRND